MISQLPPRQFLDVPDSTVVVALTPQCAAEISPKNQSLIFVGVTRSIWLRVRPQVDGLLWTWQYRRSRKQLKRRSSHIISDFRELRGEIVSVADG
jgi:hypothetical protein